MLAASDVTFDRAANPHPSAPNVITILARAEPLPRNKHRMMYPIAKLLYVSSEIEKITPNLQNIPHMRSPCPLHKKLYGLNHSDASQLFGPRGVEIFGFCLSDFFETGE